MIILWGGVAVTASGLVMIGVGKLIDLLGREAPPAPDENITTTSSGADIARADHRDDFPRPRP